MLEIKNLTVSIKDKIILQNLSFKFEKGKTYLLVGPNGSGKSTLAHVIMGAPFCTLSPSSSILFEGKEIKELSSYERAKLGLFLSFQTPPSISGVSVYNLLRAALKTDALSLRKKILNLLSQLGLGGNFVSRSLNEDFSGGEKKKMEALQSIILRPKFAIFDELDTGLDIDSLKKVVSLISEDRRKDSTYLFITHYSRLINYLNVDKVLIMSKGKIVREGGPLLVKAIEKEGYKNLIKKSKKN